jgi:hypothetical protein
MIAPIFTLRDRQPANSPVHKTIVESAGAGFQVAPGRAWFVRFRAEAFNRSAFLSCVSHGWPLRKERNARHVPPASAPSGIAHTLQWSDRPGRKAFGRFRFSEISASGRPIAFALPDPKLLIRAVSSLFSGKRRVALVDCF